MPVIAIAGGLKSARSSCRRGEAITFVASGCEYVSAASRNPAGLSVSYAVLIARSA
jgi:hypothetical protein